MLPASLTPEQRKAIKVLEEGISNWQSYFYDDITRREICITDFKAFITQKISYSDLQHGPNWNWNQSNAKKSVSLNNGCFIIIQKFNTRKIKKTIPSDGIIFKLWMFTVFSEFDNSYLGTFMWCEKGLPSASFRCFNKKVEIPDFTDEIDSSDWLNHT